MGNSSRQSLIEKGRAKKPGMKRNMSPAIENQDTVFETTNVHVV